MKARILTFIAAATLSYSVSAQTDFRSDAEKMNLQGQVKSINEVTEAGPTVNYTFNDHGYLINTGQQYVFDSRGLLIMASGSESKSIFEYDSKGFMTDCTVKKSDGTMYRESYKYNDNGKPSYCKTSNAEITYTYDASGNLLRTNDAFGALLSEYAYASDGKMTMNRIGNKTVTFTYDSKGRKQTAVTDDSGAKTTETFSYNDQGFVVKYVVSTAKSVETHNYTLDGNGNWVKDEITLENNGVKSSGKVSREIEYFTAARRLYLIK